MTRVLSAAGSLVAALGIAAGASASAATDEALFAAVSLAAGAILVLGAALAGGWSRLVVWAVAALGASYASSLPGRSLDLGAAAAGAGLLLVAELAHWSISSRRVVVVEAAVTRMRAGTLAASTAGAAGLGMLVLGVSVVPARGGYALEALGGAGAAGVVLLAALALRRG